MAIHQAEWLHLAQALSIGQSKRTYHNDENRANLVIGNDPDKWWCYCHRCHEGGVLEKTHVVLGQTPEVQPRVMPWPNDACQLHSDPAVFRAVFKMLLGKGIDINTMLDGTPLWYSKRDGRLLVGTRQGWLGRAISGQQPKWVGYTDSTGACPLHSQHIMDQFSKRVIVTEDFFSALKIRWAIGTQDYSTVAALGTRLGTSLLRELLGADEIIIAFDGDDAGDQGYAAAARRLRGLGKSVCRMPTPRGLDPKDMTSTQIQGALCRSSTTSEPTT